MEPTPGEWVVVECVIKGFGDGRPMICVATINNEFPARITKIVAIVGVVGNEDHDTSLANAALIAASPLMIESMIDIQEELNTSRKTIDLEKINEIISRPLEKIAAEAIE